MCIGENKVWMIMLRSQGLTLAQVTLHVKA